MQAFQRIGLNINPNWLFEFHISGKTILNPKEIENIWDTVQRNLRKEKQIQRLHRQGKEQWLQMLYEAMAHDDQKAFERGEPVLNYDKAILCTLSQTGRLVNPDILLGVPTWHRDSLEDERVTDQIWELACLELDHEKFVIQGKLRSPYQKKQKIDYRTNWTKKLRELVYDNLKEIRQDKEGKYNSELILVAFSSINWIFEVESFRTFNKNDPYSLLYPQTQNDIWHHANQLREQMKKPKTFSEFPAEVLRLSLIHI